MKDFKLNKSQGYKKLSDSECGRKKQTHIGLTDSFFYFIEGETDYEVFQDNCKLYFENSITKSSCNINAIKDASTGNFRNPKLTSGENLKNTVFKLIKEIAKTNKNEYYLVWDYSSLLGSFLLIEKDGINYDLIKNLDDNSIGEEIKVKLIEKKITKLNNLNKDSGFSQHIIISNKNLREFSLSTIKTLINEFSDEFILKRIEKFDTKIGEFEHIGYKIPEYFNSIRVFGEFENENKFNELLNSKERKRYHNENLNISGKSNIYFTTEIEYPRGKNLYFGDFKRFIEDYSKDKYSIKKEEGIYVLYELNLPGLNYEQKIYFGSPGTGKSRLIKNEIGNSWPRITFHPELDYQGFVGAYKPTMKPISNTDPKEEISYEYVPEAFIKAYCKAWKSTKPYYLIIEEINRGNCAQIFGDIFQLLDRDNESGYSQYPIDCSPDVQKFLAKEFKDDFDRLKDYEKQTGSTDFSKMALPNNLNIFATMNTSDQSLFPMDSAFKRRWDWQYVPINYEDAKSMKIIVGKGYEDYNWGDFILSVNEKIKAHDHGEDKQIGNRFVSPKNGIITAEQFVSKVLFYLWSEIYKDEQGTGNTIFLNSKDDSEILFSDFFEFDGEIKKTILINFLNYILPKEEAITEQGKSIKGEEFEN